MGDSSQRWTRAGLAACVLVPSALAAAAVQAVPDAAHDLGALRAVGFGWTGPWRALDAAAASLLLFVPVGTRAARASLVGAALVGLASAVLFVIARALALQCAPSAKRIGPAAAAAAVLTATLGVAWQLEAATPGGSVLGALVALAPLALAPGAAGDSLGERVALGASLGLAAGDSLGERVALGASLGLAASYEPLVGLSGMAGVVTYFAAAERGRALRHLSLPTLGAFALGVGAPLLFAIARMRAEARLVLPRALAAAPLGEAGVSGRGSPLDLVHAELGWIFAALAVAGAVLALASPRARALGAGLVAIVAVGVLGALLGAPAGPTRWAAPALAALGALAALAAVSMQAVVRAIAEAGVPFASASATMVVVLELAFPARVADEAWTRAEERARGGARMWDEAAWGPLPLGTLVLLNDARALERALAARALGSMREDLAIVPISDLGGRLAGAELAREPRLSPFVRDMALVGAPEELSLSSLATARPLAMVFDPRWDRTLARHLVPVGLVSRFEPEPRGSSDRRHALERGRADLSWLERYATSPCDPELCAAAASLLRARAVGYAAAGDREMIARGLDELRPFAPNDRVASELVRRVVTAKGAIEVKDLAP